MNVAEMLARNARMYPNETALIELRPSKNIRNEISWKGLDERANRMANALIARGIRKGDKVIHWMMNSINWLEAYFGIIRSGAWVVPLNFRFTSQDLVYCADIAEAKAMVLGEEFIERVEAVRPQLATIKDYIFVGQAVPKGMEDFKALIDKSSPEPPGVTLHDEDACGLYFTSGTTGAPKPILLIHKNMEYAAITENYGHYIKHEDNFILIPPLYHTGAKMHWFGSLIVGGRATILTEMSPKNLFDAVHKERGTVVFLLVPWAQDILGALDRGELKKEDYDLSCWRLMHMGAQPVPPSVVRHWKEYFPDMQYDTTYGLSESTGPGCVHLGIENEHKVGAIGKAGFNWKTRIVNEKGEDITRGEIGELIVRGNGVMKEYYKNPEKTRETLKDGWLYTGDMAKTDNEGFIYLVDRKKDVIITGGENIFPVEVEQILQSHPKIYDVGVIGIPDERLGEVVAAIIDPKPDMTLTEEEVNEFCEQNLPRYKRPRRIFFDKVPRNPTGKIEKPKLREKYAGYRESFRI
ncbi:MAG: acyl--CoA ligase [Dehalococcoidia bacterium]|nr:acyl--CoA ligase [Dehalococcoidia bacterium]